MLKTASGIAFYFIPTSGFKPIVTRTEFMENNFGTDF